MFALPAPADDAVAAAARIDSLIASLLPEQREEAAGLLGKQGDTAAFQFCSAFLRPTE